MPILDSSYLYNILLSVNDYKVSFNLYYYKPGFLNNNPLDF
jgi:hypothetical protein